MNDFELHCWQLRNHELFSQLNETEIRTLLTVSEFEYFEEGCIIYPHSRKMDRIYLLIKGRIKIACHLKENAEGLLEILKEGDIFGELTLRSAANIQLEFAEVLSARAITCSFPIEEFKKILMQIPEVNTIFSGMIAEKLKIISGKYCDLILKDTKTRVLNFFILHAQHEGKWTGNKAEINMYCTHQDIANFIASKRQTVTTIINSLIRENKIVYEGRSKLIIPDIKKLVA